MPAVSRLTLSLCSRFVRQPHWLISRIASELDYYPEADAMLGNGMTIRLFWGTVVGTGILVNGFHEPHTVRVAQRLLQPGMTFIDVGANVGQYTLLASDLVGSSGHVHSFEPEPRTYRVLERNISENRLANVTINRCAVTDDASVVPGRCSLDGYARESGLTEIHLIKIDIDGGEFAALDGARELLARVRPRFIVEFAEAMQAPLGHSCADLANLLRGFDYNLFCIDGDRLIPYAPWGPERAYFNVLALPHEASNLPADLAAQA